MYMMSAGKAEVNKLSKALDDTAKVVHELKSELNKQKSSHSQQPLGKTGDTKDTMDSMPKATAEQANTEKSTSNEHSMNRKLITHSADSDYASSVVTDEHQAKGSEMGQLEAELESELQKLPWGTDEASGHAGNITHADETEICESMSQSLVEFQCGGVSPAELRKKLSDVLMMQQENHILELESELYLAYAKLKEKEAELQALKDCVKRLTEFSLSTMSDEETEARAAREENAELDSDKNLGYQTTVVGMKRSMAFEMCDC